MTRALLAVFSLLAPFLFPWPLAASAAFALALFEPVAGIALGIIADVLYFAPHAAPLPYATLAGAAGSLVALFVRRFVKARIMTA